MQDFISKVTFGFVMAQFVPGVIVVLSLSFLYATIFGNHLGVREVIYTSMDIWVESTSRLLVFSAFSIAAGMAIHGLHWAVLGFLENHRKKSIANSFWHDKIIFCQIFLGPIKIVCEILWMLFCGKSIKELAIQENVGILDHTKIEGFKFLQDFYLHFAQFYAHTSYAMVVLISVPIAVMCSPTLSFSWPFLGFLFLAFWVGCGFFFTISRIQFQALWLAEESLSNKSLKVTPNCI